MTNIAREKYVKLMTEVEELEDEIEADGISESELKSLKEQLADKRNELTRLSDGCGYPHPHN